MTAPATLNFSATWQGYGAVPTPRTADPASLQQLQGETMGTRWALRWANPDMRPLAHVRALVQAQLDLVIAQMSHWAPDSLISRFNRAPAGQAFALPPEFAQVLHAGLHWARASQGAFDPAAGQLVALWGFGPHAQPAAHLPPSGAALAQWRSLPNWQTLLPAFAPCPAGPCAPAAPSASKPPNGPCHAHPLATPPQADLAPALSPITLTQAGGLWLDFSGIAKGFAVDLVARALLDAGLPHFLIDIGGELRAHGQRPDGQPWRVQVDAQGADAPNESPPTVLALHNRAVATSGSRWHQLAHRGQSWSHTVDSRSGMASASPLLSVTVLHPQCLHADALATTMWVLGPQAGLAFAQAHAVAARWRLQSGEVFTSPHWPAPSPSRP